ncbi:MAG: hypothetical protein MJ010_02100 [Paludibacteraceae bacterium]|nr:hypothetical protein [Paludibacteraceae bacterium]
MSLLLFVLPINAKNKSADNGVITNPIKSLCFPPNIYEISQKYFVDDVNHYKVEKTTLKGDLLTLYIDKSLSNLLFSEDVVNAVYDSARSQLPVAYKDYKLSIRSLGNPIESYVPNLYRNKLPIDERRIPNYSEGFSVVINLDKPAYLAGLSKRNIALWSSHGYYYNRLHERWEWMRPRMFGSVEDLLSTSVVVPYLVPMLQNAGACVFNARERDINTNEFSFEKTTSGKQAEFKCDVTEKGEYWVKVRYPKQKDKLRVRIDHAGVVSNYEINASVGYGTWIYIDKLYFDGLSKVEFATADNKKALVDSVVIGGGMSHCGSGYPRFMESALYNLRESGVPDSISYDQKKGVKSDYYDDIYCRSKWVNFLMGGSDRYPSYPGLEIPIDMAFSVHTDAFVRDSNKVIGTLVICRSDSIYPSGYSRMASNDLSYIIENQVMSDFKSAGVDNWTQRGVWHADYAEARVPMVPMVIVEGFSHQNFGDVKVVLEPKYRFIYARSIYKAILKFLAYQYGETYVVQPLPIKDFGTEFAGSDSVRLSWRPFEDPTEPTAYPTSYRVYVRKNDSSFDNGTVVKGTNVTLPISRDTIYSYKVTACNQGGESFPSEILSVCKVSGADKTALIVNCFDRVSGPLSFDFGYIAGFSYEKDFGVPYLYDIAYTGPQIEFERRVPFINNDYSGFGSSLGIYDKQVIAGNTFDYPYVHGLALKDCGFSFVSCSKKSFINSVTPPSSYYLLDLITGLQRNDSKFELFPTNLQSAILKYTRAGRNVILSGAFIGRNGGTFGENTFRYTFRAPFASTNGNVTSATDNKSYSLQMTPSVYKYFLQNVDAIDPKYKGAKKLLYYSENHLPAALYYENRVVVGFPLEALQTQDMVNDVMRLIVSNFK